MFNEVIINQTDSFDEINAKTSIAKGLLDLQSHLSFVSKEEIITACNDSITRNIDNSPQHLIGVTQFVETCVRYPFPLSLRITYPHIKESLTILEERVSQDGKELVKNVIEKAKENYGLSLIGSHGSECS